MVNPLVYPVLRRGSSGPRDQNGGGNDFAPFDNERWLDPAYAETDESGSIAQPFLTWDVMVAELGTQGWYIHLPGYPVSPGREEIVVGGNYLFEGSTGTQIASYLDTDITLSGGGTSESVKFRNLYIASIILKDDGEAPLTFENCAVEDIVVDDLWEGEIFGFNSTFSIEQVTNDCNVHLTGGYVIQWSAQTFELTDMLVGDGTSAGALQLTGVTLVCRGVTFTAGSTIEFLNSEGTVYLDPESYKSYLDNDIDAVNAVVVRLDGSYPVNAATYAGTGDVTLNWFKNPRAYIEQTGHIDFDAFAPLTRYLTLIVDNQTSGEGFEEFSWWDGCVFGSGIVPEQESGISVYIIEYEAQLDLYLVYVAGMNFLPPV